MHDELTQGEPPEDETASEESGDDENDDSRPHENDASWGDYLSSGEFTCG